MLDNKLSNRQKLILKAIIEAYVETNEPVGSKILTEKPYLDFSSATIRYDMAYLEELGLLEKPHTSSGRIPSTQGYKYYVEHLVIRDYDVTEKFPLIDEIFSNENLGIDDVVQQATKILSELTNYMTVAYSGNLDYNKIKKLDLIRINNNEAVLLIVTNQGIIEHQRVQIPVLGFEKFYETIQSLDQILNGIRITDVERILKSPNIENDITDFLSYRSDLMMAFSQAFIRISRDKLFSSGLDNIFNQPEFQDVERIKQLVKTIEQQNISKVIDSANDGLTVRIGSENMVKAMDDCTIISIPFLLDSDEKAGTIAVIGPTRMEYRRVIPLIEYIAKNMSKLFKK